MKLNELKTTAGSRKERYRKGRGTGSGNGKTAGRGMNGQKSRSGGNLRIGFEGGQTPLYRRLPKRGFTNGKFKKEYSIVSLSQLDKFDDGTIVTPELLLEKKIISKVCDGVKVLGNGTLSKSLTVKVHKFSNSAKESIEAKKGKIEEM